MYSIIFSASAHHAQKHTCTSLYFFIIFFSRVSRQFGARVRSVLVTCRLFSVFLHLTILFKFSAYRSVRLGRQDDFETVSFSKEVWSYLSVIERCVLDFYPCSLCREKTISVNICFPIFFSLSVVVSRYKTTRVIPNVRCFRKLIISMFIVSYV